MDIGIWMDLMVAHGGYGVDQRKGKEWNWKEECDQSFVWRKNYVCQIHCIRKAAS